MTCFGWRSERGIFDITQGGSNERAVLAALEEGLSLEEVSHFRAGVASIHSR